MRIRITPGALLLFAVMLFTGDVLFWATLRAATVHECGHLLAARALGIRLRLLELDIPGARIVPAGALPSYLAEGVLAVAGPVASLLLAALVYPLNGTFFAAVLAATLSLGLFNLLPVGDFDGGRLLAAVLTPLLGLKIASRIRLAASYLSIFFLFSLSATLLLRFGENLSLAVLCASLFARIFLFEQMPPAPSQGKRRI
jgi:Zn-dependent protease